MSFAGVLEILNSENVVLGAGFAAGFLYAFKFTERTLNHPLKTIFASTIEGAVALLGTSIVCSILPEQFRFIIPITLGLSCIYWKYQDLFGPKKRKGFMYKTNNNIHD